MPIQLRQNVIYRHPEFIDPFNISRKVISLLKITQYFFIDCRRLVLCNNLDMPTMLNKRLIRLLKCFMPLGTSDNKFITLAGCNKQCIYENLTKC